MPTLRLPLESVGAELLMLAAVKLYELSQLSSGAAAELAGVPKPVFLQQLARYGVNTFTQSKAELDKEADNA